MESAIANVNSPGHGFIVEAYFINTGAHGEANYKISGTPDGIPSRWFLVHDTNTNSYKYVERHQFEIYDNETYKRIDKTKKYKIYVGVYKHSDTLLFIPFIDKIEGEFRTPEEVAVFEAQQKTEAEAKKKAEEEAKDAKFNHKKLDRSQYKGITVEDFSFDMVAGNLAAGSKVAFEAMFFTKPTGTKYMFKDVDMGITMSSDHNFVRDIPDICFNSVYNSFVGHIPQRTVRVYLTVKKPGKYGECSADIINWDTNRLFNSLF